MKIANFKGTQSNLKVFKPIQYLYFEGTQLNLERLKLRVRVVNSSTGRVEEIIPSVSLDVLAEITSMNEGFYQMDKVNKEYKLNVMLHPTSAVYLSNDKYLEIDIVGNDSNEDITIYGIESPVIDKHFICRYNKFYMTAGELQKTFVVGENENLIIPDSSFDEVVLNYKNGSTCSYTKAELGAMMFLKNDIVWVPNRSTVRIGGEAMECITFGYDTMFGVDVAEVDNFTIKRQASTTAFEIIMIDTIKE